MIDRAKRLEDRVAALEARMGAVEELPVQFAQELMATLDVERDADHSGLEDFSTAPCRTWRDVCRDRLRAGSKLGAGNGH